MEYWWDNKMSEEEIVEEENWDNVMDVDVLMCDLKDIWESVTEEEEPSVKDLADMIEKILDLQQNFTIQMRVMKETIRVMGKTIAMMNDKSGLTDLAEQLTGKTDKKETITSPNSLYA